VADLDSGEPAAPVSSSAATYSDQLKRYPYLSDVVKRRATGYATVNWATKASRPTGKTRVRLFDRLLTERADQPSRCRPAAGPRGSLPLTLRRFDARLLWPFGTRGHAPTVERAVVAYATTSFAAARGLAEALPTTRL
jgi:hypothetical protein